MTKILKKSNKNKFEGDIGWDNTKKSYESIIFIVLPQEKQMGCNRLAKDKDFKAVDISLQ